jgi:polyisoprenoid-binding protein YceI
MNIEQWEIDSSQSTIRFVIRHFGFSKVGGQFARWSGRVLVPDGDFTRAALEVEIDASSIDTALADRDEHLRRADFFDVTRYPEITFTARFGRRRVEPDNGTTGAEPDGGTGRMRMSGALTIKGITRQVGIVVEQRERNRDSWGNERVAFTATARIDRRDFGINGSALARVVVGNKVDLEIEVEAVRQPAAARVA